MKEVVSSIKNPPKEYRGVPFWSWNDKLDPEFLRWQIGEMDKAGLGGYFMHARGGLQTEYLSEDWMKCVKACIDEGKKLGMNAWCYDEEGWPSGFAGGVVTALGDKYHVRWLEIEESNTDDIAIDETVLGIYALDNQSNKINYLGRGKSISNPALDSKLIVMRQKSNPYYIDILNKEVIKAFIESTHDKYYKHFKEDFGAAMPGFFTDEPQFARGQIPWSYILPEAFREKHGYDLIEYLPALFIECEGYEKIRYDFWSIVSDLYVTSFGKQIFDWCEEHNCQLTGHVMAENSLASQMANTAGAMPFYEYMHTPGMDWLGRAIQSPVIPKQVGSAAAQLGKKFVLSETFALCGWDVSFEELKWIAEWQYVNGVSLMCQHLEGYTLRGLRKRDYPPSMFYQQSWWKEYKTFNDYFARLGMLLTDGKAGAEVLLLHPIKSAWVAYNHSNNETMKKLDEDFVKATELLSGLHLDHHYGDETIIKKHGKVEGNSFIIGQCKYKLIVLPSMLSLDDHTMKLLNEYIDNGGNVISIGDFPAFCQGISDNRVSKLSDRVIHIGDNVNSVYNYIKLIGMNTISISDERGEIEAIHYMQRISEDYECFYMVNHSQDKSFDATIKLKGNGTVRKLNVEDAEIELLSYINNDDDITEVKLRFLPMQSHLIIFEKENEKVVSSRESEIATSELTLKEQKLGKEWDIADMDLNSLTLDYCSYSIDKGEWSNPTPVIKLMEILLNQKRNCDVALKYNFQVEMDLNKNKELFLAIETAEEFDISINGVTVQYKEQGWWKDSSFKKIDIKSYVKVGNNEITLKRNFFQAQKVYDVLFGENVLETEKNKLTFDTELESIYLVGDFGVISKAPYTFGERKAVFTDDAFVVVDKPSKVTTGDLTQQGFCFFAGTIKLRQNICVKKNKNERLILDLHKPNATMTKVFINDKLVKSLCWTPYTIDITDFVKEGSNELTIELFAGNRNLLGPHHHAAGELYFVGTTSFSDKAGWADREFEGSIWRDRYCFVKFGLEA